MTPKERELKLHNMIEDLGLKLDEVLELLKERKDGKKAESKKETKSRK